MKAAPASGLGPDEEPRRGLALQSRGPPGSPHLQVAPYDKRDRRREAEEDTLHGKSMPLNTRTAGPLGPMRAQVEEG